MNPHRDNPFKDNDEVVAALAEMRPRMEAGYAAELDAWAAVGFPPRKGSFRSSVGALIERLRATSPRRVLAPAGALATIAIVAATAVVVSNEGRDRTAPESNPSGFLNKFSTPAPETEFSGPPQTQAGEAGAQAESIAPTASGALDRAAAPVRPDSGPYAAQAGDRAIERSAEMVIATEPEQIRSAAAAVYDEVHSVDGIVLRSSIRDGEAGEAFADFELLIPSGRLGDALAGFSGIAEVRSRNEATRDITAPTVGVGERLQDTRARIDGLLAQLAEADSDGERVKVEAELRNERYRAAALKSRLSELERRANFSRVSLRIETGEAASSPGAEEGGAWGVSDGLDDAGRVLEVAAAVTLVGLAVLSPFALLALLAWLGRRAWVRRSRARALEGT